MTSTFDDAPEWLAGGTDLLERRRHGLSRGIVRELPREPRLTALSWRDDGGATIGAGVSIGAIAADARIGAAYPGLAAAAGGLATPEIRAMATLGGNLAQRSRCWYYRSPDIACLKKGGASCPARHGNHLYGVAYDLGPCVAPHPSTLAAALLAYDARVTTSARSLAALEEILGDGRDGTRDNRLGADEYICEIQLPPPFEGERAHYARATGRLVAEWPLAEMVTCLAVERGRIQRVRIAVGGVAPVPLRLDAVETVLAGSDVAALPLAEAARIVRAGATPLPLTGYKVDLIIGLLGDALERLTARPGQK